MTPHFEDARAGLPVVLLHAFPLSRSMWDAQRASLSGAHRVVTPDQRGFGATPLGADPPSLGVVAEDVARLLDALGLDTAVVGGLSMGGYVALEFARRYPQRLRGLVLADTKAAADTPEQRAGRLAMADTVERDGSVVAAREKLLPNLVGSTTKARRPEVVRRVSEGIDEAAPAAVAWAQRAMAARPDAFDVLAALPVPLLVVVGDEDVVSPLAEAHRMAEAAPVSDLVVLPGAGHLSNLEDGAAFDAALLEFLSRLP